MSTRGRRLAWIGGLLVALAAVVLIECRSPTARAWTQRALDSLYQYVATWHDTWEVVGALATAGAVIVALAGIRHERAKTKNADDRAKVADDRLATERKAADDARATEAEVAAEREKRAQARLVIAWVSWKVDHRGLGGAEVGHWIGEYGNYSTAPVFDVEVELFQRFRHHPQHPEIAEYKADKSDEAAVLPPGASDWFDSGVKDRARKPIVYLYFRDLAGTRWRRMANGELFEINEQREPLPPEFACS